MFQDLFQETSQACIFRLASRHRWRIVCGSPSMKWRQIHIPKSIKRLAVVLALFALAAYLLGEVFFNVSSNVVALSFRESKEPLAVQSRSGGWKNITAMNVAELDASLHERHREPGLRWCSLAVRRQPRTLAQWVTQGLFGAEVNILWISPDKFDMLTTFKPKFELTTASERLSAENLWFSINANFREPNGKPLGWVYHEGRQVNGPIPAWSGCFFVKQGTPYFGPQSLLDEVPGPIQEGTQGYPSVMKSHTVFPYVKMKDTNHFDGTKISYRSLAGMKKDGTLVFVLSGDGGVMNISEVTEIAKRLEVQHATCLDGGKALQYSIRTGVGIRHFRAYNTTLPFTHRLLVRERSPVYIGARRKAPEIITPP